MLSLQSIQDPVGRVDLAMTLLLSLAFGKNVVCRYAQLQITYVYIWLIELNVVYDYHISI